MTKQIRCRSAIGFGACVPVCVVLVLAASLSGCRDYFDRTDAISLDAGNAVAENNAAQVVDPWPPGAFKKKHSTNGERLLKAIERYETNKRRPSGDLDQKVSEQ